MVNTPKINKKIQQAKAEGNRQEVKALQKKKQGVIANRESKAQPPFPFQAPQQVGFMTGIDRQLQKQQNMLEQGRYKKAAKIGDKIQTKIKGDPFQAYGVGQAEANKEFQTNLQYNRPDQQTIGGSREYVMGPDGKLQVVDKLDAGQQGLYDQQIGNIGQANQMFMSGLQSSGLGQGGAYNPDLQGERARIEGEVYNRNAALADQTFNQDRQALIDRLNSTGNSQGSPLYEKQMADFEKRRTEALGNIRQDAVARGGDEWQRSFGIGLQGRQANMSELGALQQFGGGPTAMPNFIGFQPLAYQGADFGQYFKMGLEHDLAQQALAKQGQGGGSFRPPSAPSFSIGGMPAGGFIPTPQGVNPVAGGFAAGLQQGAVSQIGRS